MSAFQFAQIGVIRSPYKEKFAVPRQPGLVKHGGGELHLLPPYNQADAVRGLHQDGLGGLVGHVVVVRVEYSPVSIIHRIRCWIRVLGTDVLTL